MSICLKLGSVSTKGIYPYLRKNKYVKYFVLFFCNFKDVGDIDPKTKETVESLARSVAILGKHFEESEKERHSSNPAYWQEKLIFL